MLTRIGALALLLLVIFALVLIGARANGVPAPDSVAALFRPRPGCLPPCWHGITPEKTTVEEAIAILREDKATIQYVLPQDKSYLKWDLPGAKVSGYLRSGFEGAPEILDIGIYLEPEYPLRLGDAILLWGQPLNAQLRYCDPSSINGTQATFQFAGNIEATANYHDTGAQNRQRSPLSLPLDPSTPITAVLYHTDRFNYELSGPAVWKGFKPWTAENSTGGMCGEG